MPSCVLLLGDKLRQSRPEKFSGDGPLGTSHLPFGILVPECPPADLCSQLKSESLRTAWAALQGAQDHETLPALPGAVLEASR